MINKKKVDLIKIIEEKIANKGISDDLSLGEKRIIRYINIGAFLCSCFCLIVVCLNIFIVNDYKAVIAGFILAIIYATIPYINGLKLFRFSKIFILFFLTIAVIGWNLLIIPTPYFIILPFVVSSIFYPNKYALVIGGIFYFILFTLLKYTPFDGTQSEMILYDFFLFLMIVGLVGFTNSNIKNYELKMQSLNEILKSKNEELEEQYKLKKSEQFFRSIFENNQLGIVVVDINSQLINVNPAFCNQLGYKREELLQKEFIDLKILHEDYFHKFTQLIKGEIRNFEARERFYRADQTIMEAEMIVNGVYDKNGDFVEAIITIQDITETFYAQQALKENELKFKTLFDYSPVAITIRNIETDEITEINQVALDGLGLTREEFFAMKKENALSEKTDVKADELKLKPLIDGEVDVVVTEKMFKSKAGKDIYAEIIRSKITINESDFIVALSMDITESKLIENERKARYQEMQTFFDALPISFLHLDTENRILRTNKMSGFPNPKMIEGKFMKEVYPTFSAEQETLHKNLIQSGKSLINEIEHHSFGENDIWVKVDRIPVKDDLGKVTGIIVFSTTITDIKKAEEQLALKNAELQHYIETNLQLESFAYIASHDLKEPLRMIHSFTQLLYRRMKPHFDESSKDYMDFILDGVKRMQHLLEDLLKYSTIGRQETDLELTDLNDTIYNVIQNVQHTIKEKKAEIMIEPLPSVKVYPMQMVQLFQNLISNALKFTPKNILPIIEIGVKENEEEYIFSLKDNGIGIQKEYLQKIFLVFKRLHTKEEYNGTGIGLATCKKIIENLGGQIWVESEYSVGTTFFFTIPKK